MAVLLDTYGPYDSGPGSNITEATWRKIMRNSLNGGSGVLQGITDEFEVYADSTGMQVKVRVGECWIQGAWGESTSEKILPIALAPTTPGHTRKDRVILRNDFLGNKIELDVLTGTSSAGTPAIPSCTKDNDKWETSLGVLSIGNSVSTMAAGNVDDQREYQGAFAKYRRAAGTSQNLATATVQKNSYPTPESKTADVLVTGTNNTDFELQREGEWTVTCQTVLNASNQNGYRTSFIGLSGDASTRYGGPSGMNDTNGWLVLNWSVTQRFAALTKLSVYSYQTSGSPGTVQSDASIGETFVSFRWNGS